MRTTTYFREDGYWRHGVSAEKFGVRDYLADGDVPKINVVVSVERRNKACVKLLADRRDQ